MGTIEKQLRKIPRADRERIFATIALLVARDFATLNRKKLHGYEHIFRIRVGNYRIIYYDDGIDIILKGIKKKDEKTYSDRL